MSNLDIVAVTILAILTMRGANRGGGPEFIETISTIGASVLAYKLYPSIARLVDLPIGVPWQEMLGSFLAVLLGTTVLLAMVGYWLKQLFRTIDLGMFNPIISGMLGLIKGAVFVTAIAWCLNWMGGDGRALLNRSPITKAHLHYITAIGETILP